MTTDYIVPSRTLQVENRSFDNVIFQLNKPILDSEQNLIFDVLSEKVQRYINSQSQSGFLNFNDYQFNPTTANTFVLPESIAIVNGWQLNILANGTGNITLDPATALIGNDRYDFIFLEVWRTIISGGSTISKPDATHIFKDGNVQNMTITLSDDIIDPALLPVPGETTKRVQIQYRIRTQIQLASPNNQNTNIFDANTFAQGATIAPIVSYTFSNMGSQTGDYGLYRAGSGDSLSRSQLNTVDGYVYAIPLALVFRRAIAAYDDENIDGQKASAIAIGGTSDRPDGLFYDSIDSTDVIDVRHQCMNNRFNADELLTTAINDLITGQNTVRRKVTLQYDALSNAPITGYTINSVCDKTRSTFSDLQTTVVSHTARVNIGDTISNDISTSRASGSWTVGDTIVIKVPTVAPTGTIILGTDDLLTTTKPFVFFNNNTLNSGGLYDVEGSWSGTGSDTATFTIASTLNLTNQEIWVTYDIQYPSNQGMTFVSDQLLSLDYTNAASFPNSEAAYVPHAGCVRIGSDLMNQSLVISGNSKQLYYQHSGSFNNYLATYTLNNRNKSISITPVISTTTVVDGTTRTMSTKNVNSISLRLNLPFATNKTWFIRGVYTAATAGSEIATSVPTVQSPSSVVGQVFTHTTAIGQSYAHISSMTYFTTELIYANGGNYVPVYRQSSNGDVNKFVLVHYSTGVIYTPPSLSPSDYQITHRSIATANVAAYNSVSLSPVTNFIQLRAGVTVTDGQQLWLDIDYIGEPHNGAEIKMIYKYLPYQGFVESVELQAKLMSLKSMIHTDGTANITANIDPVKYSRPLISYFPMPIDQESNLSGSSVAGAGNIGLYISNNLCYTMTDLMDYSASSSITPLKINDIVTAKFNGTFGLTERGGNECTALKGIMMPSMSVANYKQAVVFGLAIAKFGVQNEIVLYVWTYTNNITTNLLSSLDTTHIGVDFYFINKRPLIKFDD